MTPAEASVVSRSNFRRISEFWYWSSKRSNTCCTSSSLRIALTREVSRIRSLIASTVARTRTSTTSGARTRSSASHARARAVRSAKDPGLAVAVVDRGVDRFGVVVVDEERVVVPEQVRVEMAPDVVTLKLLKNRGSERHNLLFILRRIQVQGFLTDGGHVPLGVDDHVTVEPGGPRSDYAI